jgi:DNA-binding transcriptional LysR family regulator
MAADAELPLTLSCDNQALLRDAVLGSDTILLTWEAWLQADLSKGRVVDLGARLRPAIPAQARQLGLGLVHLAGRTLSPAARTLMNVLLEHEKSIRQ